MISSLIEKIVKGISLRTFDVPNILYFGLFEHAPSHLNRIYGNPKSFLDFNENKKTSQVFLRNFSILSTLNFHFCEENLRLYFFRKIFCKKQK